jgi:hypothetical protein
MNCSETELKTLVKNPRRKKTDDIKQNLKKSAAENSTYWTKFAIPETTEVFDVPEVDVQTRLKTPPRFQNDADLTFTF